MSNTFNKLQSLIREALEEAYTLHENELFLSEDTSAEFAAKLNPERKAYADKVIDILVNQKPGWHNYQWDPTGKTNKLNETQWNYIVETLAEQAVSTQDPKYGVIFSSIYNAQPKRGENNREVDSALYNTLVNKSGKLAQWAKSKKDVVQDAIINAWGKLFYTDTWLDVLNKYKSTPGKNFGSFLLNTLWFYVQDLTKASDVTKRVTGFNSIDAPSNVTGKATDLDGGMEDGIPNDGGIEDDDEFEPVGDGSTGVPDDREDLNADQAETGILAKPDSGNADVEFQDRATREFKKFQKSVMVLINSARTLGLPELQQKGLIVLKDIIVNFLDYNEIANKYSDAFGGADVKGVVNKLKRKNFIEAANNVLSKYHVTYDIFQEKDWESKYNIPSSVVQEILDNYFSRVTYSSSEKAEFVHIFQCYALKHMTPEQIAATPREMKNKSKGKTGTAMAAEDALNSLKKNPRFIALADSTFNEFGFPKVKFNNIAWQDIWKAGRKLLALDPEPEKANPEDVAQDTADAQVKSRFPFQMETFEGSEQFISENLEQIMERVYKRLEKLL